MPIYEYACLGCGAEFERFIQALTAAATIACPACRSRRVSRRLSLVGVKTVGRPGASPSGSSAGAGGCCGGGCGCH